MCVVGGDDSIVAQLPAVQWQRWYLLWQTVQQARDYDMPQTSWHFQNTCTRICNMQDEIMYLNCPNCRRH